MSRRMMNLVTDPLQLTADHRESSDRIIAFAKGEDWYNKGVEIPAYLCASDDYLDDYDPISDDSRNAKLYELWNLFSGAGGNMRLNVMFRKMVKSPMLEDQMDEIIGLFPVLTPSEASAAGKTVNATSILWSEWERQNGAARHTPRNGVGDRLQTSDRRTDRVETIIPMGAQFVMPLNFLDTEQGERDYLLELDSLLDTFRYAWVRHILSCARDVGLDNLARAYRSRLPLPRQELHTMLKNYAEGIFTLSKSHNLGMEGLESTLVSNLLGQCKRQPDWLLVDPTVSRDVFALRADSMTIEGAPDTRRRDQSLVGVGKVYSGQVSTIKERLRVLCAPPIPDLHAGITDHVLRSNLVFGDFVTWLANADAAKLDNEQYKTTDRAISVYDGGTGQSESIQLEQPLAMAGLFHNGKLTWHGAGTLRGCIEYRPFQPMALSSGQYRSDAESSNGQQVWYRQENVEIRGESTSDTQLWKKIQDAYRTQNMAALENTIEYSQIPPSINLYNVANSAGYLERYRKDLSRLSNTELAGLEEADRMASLGGSGAGSRQPTARRGRALVANTVEEKKNGLVIHIPTSDTDQLVHDLLWPRNWAEISNEGKGHTISFRNDSDLLNRLKNECKKLGHGATNASGVIVAFKAAIKNILIQKGIVNPAGQILDASLEAAVDEQKIRKYINLLFFGDSSLPLVYQRTPQLQVYRYSIACFLSDLADDWTVAGVAGRFPGTAAPTTAQYYAVATPVGEHVPEIMAFVGPTCNHIAGLDNKTTGPNINLLCSRMRDFRYVLPSVEFANLQRFVKHLLFVTATDEEVQLNEAIGVILGHPVVDPSNPWKDFDDIKKVGFIWDTAVQRMVEAGSRVQMGSGGGGSLDIKDGTHRSPSAVDNLLKRIKISSDVFVWLLRNNIVFPLGFIGVRPDNCFAAAHALAGTKSAMFTLIKDCDMTTALRQEHSDLVFSAKMEYAIVAEKRQEITVAPYVKPLGYIHGAGTTFIYPTHAARRAYVNSSLSPKNAQMIAIVVPATWKPTSGVIDLFGTAHPELQIQDDNAPLDYPTAPFYVPFWGGFGIRQNVHVFAADNLKRSGRVSTLWRTAYHQKRDGVMVEVEGQGPLGYHITPMTYHVAGGGGFYGGSLEGSRRYE